MEQIGAYKIALHRRFLGEWIARTEAVRGRSLDEVWQIREACIAALSAGAGAAARVRAVALTAATLVGARRANDRADFSPLRIAARVVPRIAKRRAPPRTQPPRIRGSPSLATAGLCLAARIPALAQRRRAPPTTSDGGHNGVHARYAVDPPQPARVPRRARRRSAGDERVLPDLPARGARPVGARAALRDPRGSLRAHVSRPAAVRPLERPAPRPPCATSASRGACSTRGTTGRGAGGPDRRPEAQREQPEQHRAHRGHDVRGPVPRPRRHVRPDVATRPGEGADRVSQRADPGLRPRLGLRRRAVPRSRAVRSSRPRQPRAADQAPDRGRRGSSRTCRATGTERPSSPTRATTRTS